MKNLTALKFLIILFVICCLISAVIVIALVSRYERQEEQINFKAPLPDTQAVEEILPAAASPMQAEAPVKEKEPPEKEMPLKEGEPLLY